jgi:NAD/NADP transhydrogenase beta subunit
MIVAGMIVGASGSILTNLMAVAMNRSIPAIVFGSFGGADAGGGPAGGDQGTVKATSAADAAIQMAYANQVIVVPGYGSPSRRPSTPSRRWPRSWRARASRSVRHPPGGGSHARA